MKEDELPVVTREAQEEVKPVDYLGKIAQTIFAKKSSLTAKQKSILVADINDLGNEMKEDENQDIACVGCDMSNLTSEDIEKEDNKQIASRIASFAKKLIIVGERKMAENLEEAENKIEEDTLATAERIVKLAKVLKSKKKELTAKQEKVLQAELLKIAENIKNIGAASDEEEDKLSKSDFNKTFDKTRAKNNKMLKMLRIDWDALAAHGIAENTLVKNLTVEQLKRIIMSVK